MVNKEKHSYAVASLVLGICSCASIFLGLGAIIGVILGIIGVVLAVKAVNAGNTESITKAGKVLSIIGLCVCGVVFVLAIVGVGILASMSLI